MPLVRLSAVLPKPIYYNSISSAHLDFNLISSVSATGGTLVATGKWRIHIFTTSGTLTVATGGECEVLVVGGGGGASQGSGGGGGIVEKQVLIPSGTYAVTVGAGGTGDNATSGVNTTNGGDSSIVGGTVSLVGLGGGGGGGSNSNGKDGGSGGGGGGNSMGTTYGGAALQPASSSGGYGFPGIGNQASNSSPYYCGVGGGGGGSPTTRGGPGGPGRVSLITGTAVTYAAGGTGNNYYGGGAAAAAANSGNGGNAAGGASNSRGSDGGTGIVVVRYERENTIVSPLDGIAVVPWACYGVRLVKSDYAGSLIRLRRALDSTERDFGSTESGDLDVASILSWVGTGDAFVRTWYDQSGNGRHMIQATNSSQPQFVKLGALYLSNNRPYIKFNGVENGAATPLTITANSPIAVHAVQYRPGNGVSDWVLGHTSAYNYHGTSTNKLWDSYAASSVKNGTTRCMGQLFSPAINCNNAPIQSPCVIHHTNTSGAEWNNLGQDRSYHQSTGGYFELIVWATQAYTSEEALKIHNDQMAYYVPST